MRIKPKSFRQEALQKYLSEPSKPPHRIPTPTLPGPQGTTFAPAKANNFEVQRSLPQNFQERLALKPELSHASLKVWRNKSKESHTH